MGVIRPGLRHVSIGILVAGDMQVKRRIVVNSVVFT